MFISFVVKYTYVSSNDFIAIKSRLIRGKSHLFLFETSGTFRGVFKAISNTFDYTFYEDIILIKSSITDAYPVGNYMFKVSNRNTKTRREICSKLTIKIQNDANDPMASFWYLDC